MTCGFLPYAEQAANRACPIAAGSTLGIQWHHENDLSTDDILDSSHKGPVIFYLSKTDDGSGNTWFKIYEDGYTSSNAQWATDRLIAADGLVTVTIPSDIEPGNYLLRGEVLALHQAEVLNGVQPYVGCAELTISGSGSSNPSASGVDFPGAYSPTDPGILFNIYTTFTTYPIPGPALYVSGSSSSSTSSSSSSSSSSGTATSAPTSTPTSTPTTKPTTTPTVAPSTTTGSSSSSSSGSSSSSSSGSISVQMNQGSSTWWLGLLVSGGSQTTAKVEITDSGSVSSWTQLVDMSYAYVFDESVELTLPISVRLTSTSGNQVTLTNVFTSWSSSLINTGEDYSSSSSSSSSNNTPSNTATEAPSTPAPTHAATSTSGSASSSSGSASSSSGSVTVTVYSSASGWWFACTVSGSDSVASVELKDSSMSSYALMTNNDWGYSLETEGAEFVAPITIRVTNEAGQAVSATLASITPGLAASAN